MTFYMGLGEDAGSPTAATPAEIAALRDLLEFGRTDIAAHLRADGEPDSRALIAALFSRATTTLQALALLVENHFGQQAMMLNRATFELMVDSYWIEYNRELAAERFVQHARLHQHLKREAAARYPDLLDLQIPEGRLGEAELAELGRLYGVHGVHSWTGLNVHQRVEAIAEGFDDNFDREQLRSFRDMVYPLDNQELHPTPWSIGRALRHRSAEDGRKVLQYRLFPEPELGPFALRCAWWIYLQILHLLIDVFDLPLADALDRLKGEAPWRLDPNSG